MQKNSGFIKIGAVLSSLALATSFVWYQSRGNSRIMSGSKSSAVSAAATPYVEPEDVTRDNAAGELEINPQALATSATTTRPLTAEEEVQIRKAMMFSSKSGIVFDPSDAAPSKPFTIIPVPPPSQPAVSPPRRRTIMPGSKTLIIDDMPSVYTEPPKPAQRPAQSVEQKPQQQQRRVLLPSSKSKAFNE